jgi:hypothetical protein
MRLLTTITAAGTRTVPPAIAAYGIGGAYGSNCATEGVIGLATDFLQKEPVDRLMDVTARVMRAEAELPVLVRNIPHMRRDEIAREVEAYHSAVIEVHEQLKQATGLVQAMERQISRNYGRPR